MIYYKEHSNHFNIVIAFHVTYKGPKKKPEFVYNSGKSYIWN